MSQVWRAKTQAVPRAVGDLFLPAIIAEMQIKGIDCTWQKADMCPCWSPAVIEGSSIPDAQSTQPQPACLACRGDGWLLYGSQSGRFLLTSAQSASQTQGAAGYVQPGSFSVTALVEQPLGIGDRITVNSSVRAVQQQFIRVATTDQLRFPIVNKTWAIGSAADPSIAETVTLGVDYLVAANATTGAIVGGATPTEYVQNVNFTVTAGGLIDWTIGGNNIPPVGARCSVRYYARPRYIVTSLPFTHRQLGFIEFAPARYEQQLLWRGVAMLESLGDAPP